MAVMAAMLAANAPAPPASADGMFSVDGTITNQSGDPVVNVAVDVRDTTTGATVASTVAGSAGQYSVSVPAGVYNFVFTPPATYAPATLTNISVTAATQVNVILLPAPPQNRTFNGHVLDRSGAPLSVPSTGRLELSLRKPASPVAASALIGNDGAFSMTAPAAQYNFFASYSDSAPASNSELPHTFDLISSAPLDLNADRSMDLQLPSRRLTVHVIDTNGAVVTNARVTFGGWGTVNLHPQLSMNGQFNSEVKALDATGTAVLPGFPIGSTMVRVYVPQLAPVEQAVTFVNDDTITVTVPAGPPPPRTLSGHVLDRDGVGLNVPANASLSMRLSKPASPPSATGNVGIDGVYSLTAQAGSYLLGATYADNSAVPSSTLPATFEVFTPTNAIDLSTDKNIDIQLPNRQLTVRIVDNSGNPVTNASVAFDGQTTFAVAPALTMTGSFNNPSRTVDGNGAVMFGAFPSPNATLRISVPGMPVTFRTIAVTNDASIEVAVAITPPPPLPVYTLTGHLLDRDGQHFDLSRIGVSSVRMFWGTANPPEGNTFLKADGTFTAVAPAHSYRLSAEGKFAPGSSGNLPELFYFSSGDELNLDADRDVNFKFQNRNISVHVVDAFGAPVPNAKVSISGSTTVDGGPGLQMTGGFESGYRTVNATGTAVLPTFTSTNALLWIDIPGSPLVQRPVVITDDDLVHVIVTLPGQEDVTAPVVTGTAERPAVNGWYNAPVTITWSATDPSPSSGAPTVPTATIASTEGSNVVYTSQPSCDPAGNCAAGTHTVSLDITAPNVTITGPSNGATYALGSVPATSCVTADALSGVATPASLSVVLGVNGAVTVNCSGALDNAGNPGSTSLSYTITPTTSSLGNLTSSYISASGSPNSSGAISSLMAKLNAGQVCQFISGVNQQTSGPHPTLTSAQATELIYWARIIDPSC